MKDFFKEKGLKLTHQREKLMNIISSLNDNATINNIYKECLNEMDKSTMYRIIELFLKKDVLTKNLNYNNEVYYLIKEKHSHHFTCVKCHKQVKIDVCPINNLENDLEKKCGYKILNHIVEINGICKDCVKKIGDSL